MLFFLQLVADNNQDSPRDFMTDGSMTKSKLCCPFLQRKTLQACTNDVRGKSGSCAGGTFIPGKFPGQFRTFGRKASIGKHKLKLD